ncbi:MAG: tetratricopeptide repeat protein [Sphingobacteriales bacterium]|nr:MAG: tetratricopeptide repeat protein [Sphingobacteriales bacterium]
MRKLQVFIILLFASFSLFAADAPYSNWWQQANNHYQKQQYDSAAAYYEKIASQNPDDAVVYYNLGNAYYRLNAIGPAVLNYERALHLDPGNKQAKDNLSLTQSRIGNRIQGAEDIFFVRWWKTITGADKANIWAVISLLVFLSWIGWLIASRLGKARRPDVRIQIALGTGLALLLIFSYTASMRRADSGHAVIMEPDAELMNAPRESKYQSLLPEGTTVRIEQAENNWVEIQLPDGRTGWIQKDKLTKI